MGILKGKLEVNLNGRKVERKKKCKQSRYGFFFPKNPCSSVIVYCVMAKIDTIPEIKARNFFHLCSGSSHSSGITSVAPTYTNVPATTAIMVASTTGEAKLFTAMPIATPMGPMQLNTERNLTISDFGMPLLRNATSKAIDSAGW